MREYHVSFLHPPAIGRGIAGIRFYQLADVAFGFTTHGVRFEQLIKSLAKLAGVQRKLTISPEVSIWHNTRLQPAWFGRRFLRVWTAAVIGFNFWSRASEIRELKCEDITLFGDGATPYTTICIRFGKADQSCAGVFRSLYANQSTMRPFSCRKRFLILTECRAQVKSNRVPP